MSIFPGSKITFVLKGNDIICKVCCMRLLESVD